MPNPWFRMYSDFAFNPKMQALSESMQRRYVILCCLKNNGYMKKVTGVTPEVALLIISAALRITAEETLLTQKELLLFGFIDEEWNLTGWDKRQYISDLKDPTNKERQRRYRERRSNGEVTHQTTDRQTTESLVTSEDKSSSVTPPKPKKQKISFDFEKAVFTGLEAYLPAWSLACPALDLETEIARCAAWLLENPDNKKSNYARFIGNWIRKEQDRAGRVRTNGASYQMPMSFDEKRRAHNTEVLERVRKKYEEQSA